ncbi:outer membrane protein OmpA-like peptidoglycan-associated protein [Loktanella sp. PT4BL]|jgi:OOP family OmpA-OmpF porin|uniref:OmpA family protein n=1 Tax=Loktanella sp. PT4BL TaxID=2135611 RepID=UPI000D753A22|nr:OmpA family protein [Loktanella sp. PT4BL]PXW68551.1 outer membrane protein OmpA-like peptidoglycan-associated protein [Loktanella sp. PT4BL]
MIRIIAACLGIAAGMAQGQTLDFPSNASLQEEVIRPADSYLLPLGIWDQGAMPAQTVEGRVIQQAWRIAAPALTTLQLVRPLREQLRNDRYQIIFECQTEACGGFDFRFAVETLPPPDMRINIGDFRFLAAERVGQDGPEYLTLFISRTAEAGFVQITHVGPESETAPPIAQAAASPLRAFGAVSDATLSEQLDQAGRAVLADLNFETGSAQLAQGDYPSLRALADYLADRPSRTVALVGHTDSSGALDTNIALSKRRAASVLERLVSDYGADRAQLEAEGMGYLSPLASNLTEAGRTANRRVEVIVTSTEE